MSTYSIRIDFDKKTDSPERVFYAMALYIEGFNDIHDAFVTGICDGIKIYTSLERTPEGSLIANIKQAYNKVSDVSKALCLNLKQYQLAQYSSLRDEISVLGPVDSKGDIRRFVDKVNKRCAANNDEYSQLIVQSEPDLYKVATGLHKINKAQDKLKATDKVEFGNASGLKPISHSFSCVRTPEQIFEPVRQPYPSTDVLIIKKADYVTEGSCWVFDNLTRKKSNFKAKMNAIEWLERWRNREIQIWPNDALLAKVVTHYGKNHKNKDTYTHEIIEVFNILDNDDAIQHLMNLEHSNDGKF